MNYFHDMVDNIHQKRIWHPWNQCYLFTSATSHLKFARARAERHVTGTRGNSCLKKAKPSSIRRSHRKTNQPAEAWIYRSCVELAIFIGKGSVHLKFSFLNTPHDQRRCRHGRRWTRSGAVRFHTPSRPQKLARALFATGGGGDSDTCHRDNVVTWQRRLRLLSIQNLNCF